jgi:hypothetical protein
VAGGGNLAPPGAFHPIGGLYRSDNQLFLKGGTRPW